MPPRRRNKDEEEDSDEEELQALPSDEEEEEEEYVTLLLPRQLLCFWNCTTSLRWFARFVVVGCLILCSNLRSFPNVSRWLQHVRQIAERAVLTELFAIVDSLTGLLILVRAQV